MARSISPIAVVMKGSVAGVTFSSHSHNAITLRAKTQKNHPGSSSQSLAKKAFTRAVATWSTLPSSLVQGWNDWASSISRVNSLGKSFTPTGRAEFVRFNAFIYSMQARLGSLSINPIVPPTSPGGPLPFKWDIVSWDQSGAGVRIIFSNPNPSGSIRVFIARSPRLSNAVRSFNGRPSSSTWQTHAIAAGAFHYFRFYDLHEDGLYGITFSIATGLSSTSQHKLYDPVNTLVVASIRP